MGNLYEPLADVKTGLLSLATTLISWCVSEKATLSTAARRKNYCHHNLVVEEAEIEIVPEGMAAINLADIGLIFHSVLSNSRGALSPLRHPCK